MTDVLKDISKMSKEELRAHLEDLRGDRKRGYEAPVHKTRRDSNPFAGVDPEVAKKVLEELQRRKEAGE